MKELVFGFGEVPMSKKKELTKEEKQLAYLKEHEQKIVDFVKSVNPKVESVQIDWDSMSIEELKGGLSKNGGYNLSIKGTFNNLLNTEFTVDFHLKSKEEIPKIKKIGSLQPLRIEQNGGWEIYE